MFVEIILVLIALAVIALTIINFFRLKSSRVISDELKRIASGQRLATILSINGLEPIVDVDAFEPNRAVVRQRLLEALETERHSQPTTLAFCILEKSGLSAFVKGQPKLAIQEALARLLVNGDQAGARVFLGQLADQL